MINYDGEDKLRYWQEKLAENDTLWNASIKEMDERERIYRGTDKVEPLADGDVTTRTSHIRNIVAENIEAQVSAVIPQPKVVALHEEDADKARLIEDMVRNELDRLPMEQLNDMAERTVPIQGGAFWLVEWDESVRRGETVGDVAVTLLHPKQIVPQDGVYTSVDDMDYIFLKITQTKSYIYDRYGVNVDDEQESEPDVKAVDDESISDDIVTQYIAYYRGKDGAIGRFSWVNDIVLEDLDDYQRRVMHVCASCGEQSTKDEKKCPTCGGKMKKKTVEYEEIYQPIIRSDETVIPGATPIFGEYAPGALEPEVILEPTQIEYYRVGRYPIVLQKSVSVYGRLLGESDVDKMKTQQNTTNRLSQKIIDRLMKAGSRITLPEDTYIDVDPKEADVWRLKDPQQKSLIDVYEFTGNLQYELAYLAQVYEEARQAIGITDSFQGRKDATATSRVAKEFSAAQSAGRMESKRVLKQAAWAVIFESIFKLKLAYADEPRPVISRDVNGEAVYKQFNRYDFLTQNADGEWVYNDQFIFSCDTSAPLANNREALWQETRMNLETGAFGDPTQTQTLILFWNKMEQYHYPGAGEVRKFLERRLEQEQAAMAQQAQMDAYAQQMQMQQAQMQQQMDAYAQQSQTGYDTSVLDAIAAAQSQPNIV